MSFHRPEYNIQPTGYLENAGRQIPTFMQHSNVNADVDTIKSFGEEWSKFNAFDPDEIASAGSEYFDIVSAAMMNPDSLVLDLGCGSGRWSQFIADKVAHIDAIDPSSAVFAADNLLKDKTNIRVTQASTDNIPFEDNTFDFVLCLGVLHHIPDTQKAITDLTSKIKPGGYSLLYFYYNLENRGVFYKILFQISDFIRRIISVMPGGIKRPVCDIIAGLIYLPLVLFARMIKKTFGGSAYKRIPLSYYVNKNFHIMRNDALDRFGTPLEKRYSKSMIQSMCEMAGLTDLVFSEKEPYWHVVARKK